MKTKIYLSDRSVKFIRSVACDIASAESDSEAEIMERVSAALANRGDDNRFSVDQEVFDFIISELDWSMNFYLDSEKE
ncbi:MAG: hypothetical protein IJZ19_06430 [Lentisphaeria bacterium]|nr:hypothetical protein [Lentisphaeria bacterium]